MILEVIKRCLIGIGFGSIWTFVAITIMHFAKVEATVSEIWINMLCSFIIGIYFALSSFIYHSNDWSILKQTVIHFILSITVYFTVALPVGWVVVTVPSILVTTLIFIVIYAAFGYGFYRYYKKLEESMNADLEKKE